jgi:hypothetical protein
MALTETPRSSWIDAVGFIRIPATDTRYLAVFTTAGAALLYEGVPSHLPGLLAAGCGIPSVGRAYNKLVKGRYPYQRVTDDKAVSELRRIMDAQNKSRGERH